MIRYTEMVILETMRWSPILQRGARRLTKSFATKKSKLGPYHIPCEYKPYNLINYSIYNNKWNS